MATGAPVSPGHETSSRAPRFRGPLAQLVVLLRGLRHLHPAKLVFLGYLSYVLVGWAVLCLPSAQKGPGVSPLDNIFVATSALSTTGLATVSVSDSYNWFGQTVVMILIQLGGVGYMTLGSFLILARKTELSPVRTAIGQTVFSLPASFHLGEFIQGVIYFTLAIEAAGAAALYFVFRAAGVETPLWSAVFHSVSAFCTAGFGLYNDNFERFAGNFWLNAIIAALSYLGAMGFIVCLDVYRVVRGKSAGMTLTSKIILTATLWMAVIGTGLLFIDEPSIRDLSPENRLLAAFFQCMSAMTTVGFNSISIAGLSKASVLLLVVLMVIGSSPSGTGGGVKVTTISAMMGVMRSAIRGEKEVRFWDRAIPYERVTLAFASLGFYLTAFVIGVYLLELTESTPFDKNLFEVASALGTVGLSMGITATLSVLGKVIITLMMFCGRVGPLTLGSAILGRVLSRPAVQDRDIAI